MRIYELPKNKSKSFREVQSARVLEERRCVCHITYLDEDKKKLISVDVTEQYNVNSEALKKKVARFLPKKFRESWRYASVTKKPIFL